MDRLSRGIAAYASQFGIPESEVEGTLSKLIGPHMAGEAMQAAGGIWHEQFPLSLRERSLLVIAAIAAQGGAEERLRGHFRWALKHGLNREELEAALVVLAVYAGYPKASTAIEILRATLPEGDR